MHTGKKITEKYRINKLFFTIKKNELIENRFYLRTKILMKIKIRDKNKFTKKFHGRGEQFSGEQFFGGAIFQGATFLRDNFPGGFFPRTQI